MLGFQVSRSNDHVTSYAKAMIVTKKACTRLGFRSGAKSQAKAAMGERRKPPSVNMIDLTIAFRVSLLMRFQRGQSMRLSIDYAPNKVFCKA